MHTESGRRRIEKRRTLQKRISLSNPLQHYYYYYYTADSTLEAFDLYTIRSSKLPYVHKCTYIAVEMIANIIYYVEKGRKENSPIRE